MKKHVSLRRIKIILFVLFSLLSSAQYKIIAKSDLNAEKVKDIVYKDTITNKLVFKYGKSIARKNTDSIFFFQTIIQKLVAYI